MMPFKFLLVDDTKVSVESLAEQLRERGFPADFAVSGFEALDRLERERDIDIVVMEISMSGQDGIETVKRIKKQHPLVEIIILTGHATIESAIESIKSGAFDYLTKPCDINQLLSKAEQAAAKKKEREAMIFNIRTKLYITKQERDNMISRVLNR